MPLMDFNLLAGIERAVIWAIVHSPRLLWWLLCLLLGNCCKGCCWFSMRVRSFDRLIAAFSGTNQ
jgi:hypothetical protein